MRISDWSSDVCSSDLHEAGRLLGSAERCAVVVLHGDVARQQQALAGAALTGATAVRKRHPAIESGVEDGRSEEHTSELQSLMRISYAVFCLKKKNTTNPLIHN